MHFALRGTEPTSALDVNERTNHAVCSGLSITLREKSFMKTRLGAVVTGSETANSTGRRIDDPGTLSDPTFAPLHLCTCIHQQRAKVSAPVFLISALHPLRFPTLKAYRVKQKFDLKVYAKLCHLQSCLRSRTERQTDFHTNLNQIFALPCA